LVALVTLGVLSNARPGASPQRHSPAEVAIQTILAHPDWQVVVTKSPLQDAHERLDPRVRVLTGIFPLAAHLSAIDVAVSASGYNSVHELIPARVPTIFVPNPRTRTDDQVTRAFALAEAGLAVAVNEDDTARLAEEVTSVCHRSRRTQLSTRCAEVAELDGAREFAELIAQAIATGPSPVRSRANRSLKVAKLRASGARVAHLARLRD